jgi:uncharacterized membrane protein
MSESNINSRLEAFCDGVFAIAMTLLVMDIKLPAGETISSTADLWLSLRHLLPAIYAFLLSFTIIFITWFNHHGTLKLVHKSSPAFVYANGLLLLTIVILPFTTSLLNESLFTAHAAPAVVIYAATNALQALAWILLGRTALSTDSLAKSDKSASVIRTSMKGSYLTFAVYTLLTIAAFWFPQVVALLLGAIWVGWLVYGVTIKSD